MTAAAWLTHVDTINPFARALFVSDTVDAFVEAAERLIARVVTRMEASRATYVQLNERDLSKLAVDLLGELVPATAEAHSNGHVDVSISHPRRLGFTHLTECKIWDGAEGHRGGMVQVLGYATGRERRVMCLAFFVRHKRMVFLLNRLRGDLANGGEPRTLTTADHPFLEGAFVTTHEHSSGSVLAVTHLGCHLWNGGDEAAEG